MLFHNDVNLHNVAVDEDGSLTGVLNWECVSALPLWKACYHPSFLEGKPRHKLPDRSEYGTNKDGEPNNLYWEHMMEYELTQLRWFFLHEMKRREPRWIDVFEASGEKRDFNTAVQNRDGENCDSEFLARDVQGV
ncbi:hypothetical protein ABW19_dt0206687 [Dactylella cylindrospora]|nr:hypothetical protein ABW19_dt0206687 [Dactylella cylindrospora]